MEITSLEANLLLFALDNLCETNGRGHVTHAFDGYPLADIQDLRDRLMAAHSHPDED
jgi:hypothetical protein